MIVSAAADRLIRMQSEMNSVRSIVTDVDSVAKVVNFCEICKKFWKF